MADLELALRQVRIRLEDVRLVACTHAHADHYGQAAPIVERAGCELWMHPNHEHATRPLEDPDLALAHRIEVARQSGVSGPARERGPRTAVEIVPRGLRRAAHRGERELVAVRDPVLSPPPGGRGAGELGFGRGRRPRPLARRLSS
ncbi:MAG: MBL fold metallo-hydrolase [Actinomycetota bacterium]|nr:MBL fold metallo-hydrolase [Actinomycetota bacterium]